MTTPTMKWTRLSRRLGADHNPLRRRSDLVEAWLLPATIAVFLILGPIVAWATILWVHADAAAARHAARSWDPVPAVLLQATPGPMMTADGSNSWVVWVPARWTVGGQPHVGRIPAAAGSRMGTTVPVWLDRAGNVRMPPPTTTQIRDHVTIAAAAVLAVLAVLLACLALAGRCLLDRRRLEAWEAAWLSVGPQWSRQG